MLNKKRFLIIDDDSFNNKICTIVIKSIYSDTEVISFTEPEKGLEYLKQNYLNSEHDINTFILLDINMPSMTGWEFLEEYENFKSEIIDHISIYILSSSVDQRDKEKSKEYSCIDFISKPLTIATLKKILELSYHNL